MEEEEVKVNCTKSIKNYDEIQESDDV